MWQQRTHPICQLIQRRIHVAVVQIREHQQLEGAVLLEAQLVGRGSIYMQRQSGGRQQGDGGGGEGGSAIAPTRPA